MIEDPDKEIALTLKGKKRNLKASDFMDYYAKERLKLNNKTIELILEQMQKGTTKWKELIEISFLSDDMKERYFNTLESRLNIF
ncbi:hypothetical protein [Flagellimonas amoyensis]|uniref:hypothetical protein n=1 Tax=Flagellimonas amoyensis TaxID=2169401 RepID=UPI001F2C6A5F|nr:hypothetical protein [Allomuricauda amoyensis]